MTDYKKPYLLLFNAITDAAEHLLRCENIAALKTITDAQAKAEELILSAGDTDR